MNEHLSTAPSWRYKPKTAFIIPFGESAFDAHMKVLAKSVYLPL